MRVRKGAPVMTGLIAGVLAVLQQTDSIILPEWRDRSSDSR
jgi:hypothetical protein